MGVLFVERKEIDSLGLKSIYPHCATCGDLEYIGSGDYYKGGMKIEIMKLSRPQKCVEENGE